MIRLTIRHFTVSNAFAEISEELVDIILLLSAFLLDLSASMFVTVLIRLSLKLHYDSSIRAQQSLKKSRSKKVFATTNSGATTLVNTNVFGTFHI